VSGKATGSVYQHGPNPETIDREGKRYGLERARRLRSILLAVADAANVDGEHAHPGVMNIMSAALYGRTQVCEALAELVAEGWLSVTQKGGGRGRATEYAVHVDREAKPSADRTVPDQEPSADRTVSEAKPSALSAKPSGDIPDDQQVSENNGRSTTRPSPPTPPEGGRVGVVVPIRGGQHPSRMVTVASSALSEQPLDQVAAALAVLGLGSIDEVEDFPSAISAWYESQDPPPLIERVKVDRLGRDANRAGWSPPDFLFALCGSNVATAAGLDLFRKRWARGDMPGMRAPSRGARGDMIARGKEIYEQEKHDRVATRRRESIEVGWEAN
jgi:hypothetical protein